MKVVDKTRMMQMWDVCKTGTCSSGSDCESWEVGAWDLKSTTYFPQLF